MMREEEHVVPRQPLPSFARSLLPRRINYFRPKLARCPLRSVRGKAANHTPLDDLQLPFRKAPNRMSGDAIVPFDPVSKASLAVAVAHKAIDVRSVPRPARTR